MAHAFGYLNFDRELEKTRPLLRISGAVRLVLHLLACVLIGSAVHAQTSNAAQPFRFTVFSAQPIKGITFVPRTNAGPVTLAFQPTARSLRYEYRGTMPLRFVDTTSGTTVAEANIPAGMQHALLLFSPLESGKAGTAGLRYQIAVLDDSAGRHAAGGLAIINLSGLPLSGKVNAQELTLKPGLNPTLSVGRSATIKLSTLFKQRSYQSYTGTVALGRNDRALLILFPPFHAGGLEVQSRLLVDQPPAAAPVVR